MGLTRAHAAMQAIGYKEMIGVIVDGEHERRCETNQNGIGRYAKRPFGWRVKSLHWIMGKKPDFDNGQKFRQ